jgi:hypothetical protein
MLFFRKALVSEDMLEVIKKIVITVFILLPTTFLCFLSSFLFFLPFTTSIFEPPHARFLTCIPPIVFFIAVFGLWFLTYTRTDEWPNHPKKILTFIICGFFSLVFCFFMGLTYILSISDAFMGFIFLGPSILGFLYIYDLFIIRKLFFRPKY